MGTGGNKAPVGGEAATEEHVEDLVRVDVLKAARAARKRMAAPAGGPWLLIAVSVVCSALVGVTQARECLGHRCREASQLISKRVHFLAGMTSM